MSSDTTVFSRTELRMLVGQLMQVALTADDIVSMEKDASGITSVNYGMRFGQIACQIFMGTDAVYQQFLRAIEQQIQQDLESEDD
jgi:hypothetical protein